MFAKSVSLAVVALAATVAAQVATPTDHTFFTNPIGNESVYNEGDKQIFSWSKPCTPPSVWTSPSPTNVTVDLLNASDSDKAFFIGVATTIDCTKGSGNNEWTVPKGDPNALYSLRINLVPNVVYSGKFKIVSKGAVAPPPTASSAPTTGDKGNSAGALTPALTGAALVATAAMMLI
ncbi:hypothetical protein BGZ70_006353 [Mortierella alpina]|uniref:Uncharacterized protein n=1 Tax=Mortierella alpina TaxID=64518 RepID=A0A9P6J8H3_MORAP|nr:hypothetical protein BGZ70_006353 [Mortierella alpina]